MDASDPQPALTADASADRAADEVRLFIWLFWLSALIPLLLESIGSPGRAPLDVAVMSAVFVWLHVIHRMSDTRPERWTASRRLSLLLGLYVALAVLLWLGESYMLILFGVYSLTFGFSGGFRAGLALSVIPTLLWSAAWLTYGFPVGALATPVFVWITSNVIAYFTHQVYAQNEERGQLLAEISETRDALVDAERRRGTLEERARVAGEIHDTLAQGFTSIVLLAKGTAARSAELGEAGVATNLDMIERTARENLAEARRLVEALRPAALDGTSVGEVIQRLVDRHAVETGVSTVVIVDGEPRLLGGAEDILLLRSVQEGLANARKHAQASNINVRLRFENDGASVTVTDNGRGFEVDGDARPVAGGVGGHGLAMLRERVAAVGGDVEIRSSPGAGSSLTVRLPAIATPAVATPAVASA